MSSLLKFVLVFIIAYFLWSWIIKLIQPIKKQTTEDKDIKIYKTKDLESPTYDDSNAETVEYEEIKEDESH